MPAHAVTIDQEGHRVPPVVAFESGRWADEFAEPFIAASRTPWERRGDLDAQIGANAVGVGSDGGTGRRVRCRGPFAIDGCVPSRLRRTADDCGPSSTARWGLHVRRLHGARRTPTSASASPSPSAMDGSPPISREADDQVAANFNAVEAVTRSCLYYTVRVATDPTIPANGGCYRPLTVIAPSGRSSTPALRQRWPPAMWRPASGSPTSSSGRWPRPLPDRVPAASQGTMNNVLVGNDDFAYYETVAGGQGGRPGRAGQSGIQTGMTNTENTPIEALDTHYPFRVERYTLRRGSGGERPSSREGRGSNVRSSSSPTRRFHSWVSGGGIDPWGLAGGGPGATGEDWLIKPDGRRERLPSKSTTRRVRRRPSPGAHPRRRGVGPALNPEVRRRQAHNYPHPCEPCRGSAWCVE